MCIWIVMALIQTGSVNLTRWLPYLPSRGRFAQSKQRRLSRWLHNSRINVHRLYKPLIRAALAEWQEPVLYLSLDTSLFWDKYCLIRLAVVYRGRALPVAWRVFEHSSAMLSFRTYQELLQAAAKVLPSGVKIVLLADRGFGCTDLLRCLSVQFGWSYRIRLKKDAWIWRSNKGWIQLKDYHFRRGEAIALQQVYLFKEARYGPVNLIMGRNNINGEFWAVVSDEPTTLQTFAEYGLRFDIEESFLDDQASAWNLQRSEIRSVCALSRLWFVLALGTLYLTAQGVAVVDAGQRRSVDVHWFRGNSYLRIGWDWVKSVLNQGGRLLRHVLFTGHHDPEPAKASRKQHRKRSHRLEFVIQTYAYEPV